MNVTKITNETFVNGAPVSQMDAQDLIFKIKTAEAGIAELGQMKAKSKTVDALIAKQQEAVDGLVTLLDAKKV